jgi:hypothetical protein
MGIWRHLRRICLARQSEELRVTSLQILSFCVAFFLTMNKARVDTPMIRQRSVAVRN